MAQKGAITPKKPVRLYTSNTPNGEKVSILLEELKAAYSDFEYEAIAISFDQNEQKSDSFLKINPNGRIPAIVDPNSTTPNHAEGFTVFETLAILQYLVIHYDPDGHFHFRGQPDHESEIIQWMSFVHGGVGPMQGQLNHFYLYAPEKIEYGINRYHKETLRLYSVLADRLHDRDYLVGDDKGKFSIADINAYPWVLWGPYAGIMPSEVPKAVQDWKDRIYQRKAVQAGLHVPNHSKTVDMCLDPDFESKHKDTILEESDKHKGWVQAGNK